MIRLEQVTKTYVPGQAPALQNVSLAVAKGEMVALLGPSGAGKSTLLRCINGLVKPEVGTVQVGGQPLSVPGKLQAVRRQVAMIFQEFHLIDRLSVQTNVVSGRLGRYPFWRAALGLWSAGDMQDARHMLERVGLPDKADALAREISGGQRQRVAIARAMMQEPKVLLGDEPVASLDPVTARSIMQLVGDLTAESGLTTLLSLHDVALAREFCPRAVGVSHGRIVYDGPMSGVTDEVIRTIYGDGATPGEAQRLELTSTAVALAKGCATSR